MIKFCSQEQRNIVDDESQIKLINGCAGSRKTDTLIKLCLKYYLQKKNILFITLVSSVANEIKIRLENKLGIIFEKRGNHYIYESIEITNYDAMIHSQLEYYQEKEYLDECYNKKIKYFMKKYSKKHKQFIMLKNKKTDVVLIDEFQDLSHEKAKLLINIIKYKKMIAVCAGDLLQTIFEHSLISNNKTTLHPMLLWEKELDNKRFELTTCFRCPNTHINLVNLLMNDYQRKLSIPIIKSRNNSDILPILFHHPTISTNHNAYIISQQIIEAIKIIKISDNNFRPHDVAIIMSKCNDNPVFHQIKYELNKLYEQWGFKNKIKLFETKKDGIQCTIDWNKANDKTVLLSIHGVKGKGYKVVFFIGFTEGAIPNETRLFKQTEIIDYSLMNVALTRSTKWLFIGFTQSMMSRYLHKYYHQLDKYCILSWNSQNEIAKAINNVYSDVFPSYKKIPWIYNPNYKSLPVYRSDKLISTIKYDIAKLYEHPDELSSITLIEKIKFGKQIMIQNISKDLYPIFGNMGELILEREYYFLHNKYDEFIDKYKYLKEKVHYTSDDRLLNIIQDERINYKIKISYVNNQNYNRIIKNVYDKRSNYVKENNDLQNEFNKLLNYRKCKYIIPSGFNIREFKLSVNNFLSKIESDKLTSECFWNIALYNTILEDEFRNPTIHLYLNYYNIDLDDLIYNIRQFLNNKSLLQFHNKYSLIESENDDEMLKTMGYSSSIQYGIIGESDIIENNTLYEIKCPISNKYDHQWTIQTLLYSCLEENIYKIGIVNLSSGKCYYYDVSKMDKQNVIKNVLKKLKHRNRHITKLINQVNTS
jgi:hypothetical protein